MPTAERDYTHKCPQCYKVTVRKTGPHYSCFDCGWATPQPPKPKAN
jgi:predicted RNA-binding Zn-ribbon protein involved in translation (DUF1610 family)